MECGPSLELDFSDPDALRRMLQTALAASGGETDTAAAAEALSQALSELPPLPDPPGPPAGMLGFFAGQVRGGAKQQAHLAGALARADKYEASAAAAAAEGERHAVAVDTSRTARVRVRRLSLSTGARAETECELVVVEHSVMGRTVWPSAEGMAAVVGSALAAAAAAAGGSGAPCALELGAGAGLPSLAAAAAGFTAVATDCHSDVLATLRANAELNRGGGGRAALVRQLDWKDEQDTAALLAEFPAKFEVVCGSDIVYTEHDIRPLLVRLHTPLPVTDS